MAAPTQDMPPKGGYMPINFKRVPAKTLTNSVGLFGGFAVMTTVAIYLYHKTYLMKKRERLEVNSAFFAIVPALAAERDRAALKQLRKNRDYETELMKNVEGWEVGMVDDGQPIYKTYPKDAWIDPINEEYFVHGDPKNFRWNANLVFFN